MVTPGIEINKCRANANKLMGRLLHEIADLDLLVASVAGGEKMNDISKRASLKVTLPSEQVASLESKVKGI